MNTRFRTSRHLVIFCDGGPLVGHNYLAKSALNLTPDVVALLAALTTPRTEAELVDLVPGFGDDVSMVLEVLIAAKLVDRTSAGAVDEPDPLARWDRWKPLAALLHFSTRNGVFPRNPEWVEPPAWMGGAPMPEPCKHYEGASRIPLPPELSLGTLTNTLESRRTCRAFGSAPLTRDQLSTLLKLTFGVRHWEDRAPGRSAFKTSPSGGARHPVEAYVAVRHVEGTEPGLYHFDAACHDLALVRAGVDRADISRYVVGQEYFLDAAVVVLMTAVFARTMWRYRSPRAYRTILIELGHLGQTFCLIATALGLAPFTTMALSEDAIEGDLGLDGVDESAMYVVGVGTRP